MLNKILDSCKFVSQNSKYVKINYSNIDNLTNELLNFKNNHYFSSSPFGIMDLSTEELVNFLLIYDSIDFSFWGNPKWTINTEYGQIDGGFALLYSLLKLFRNVKEKSFFTYIENMDIEKFRDELKGNVEIPLLKERYQIIQNIAQVVNTEMNGNFYEYIKNTHNDTDLFNIIIEKFKSFKDERYYNKNTVYFYKLAQLLVSDILHILKMKESINCDYSHLIGCADYKIPQVLRELGILEYNDELSKIIDSKNTINENSDYEVEIRSNMLVVIDYIYNKLNKSIDRIDINDFIWLKGQDKSIEYKPYHLTRTTSY